VSSDDLSVWGSKVNKSVGTAEREWVPAGLSRVPFYASKSRSHPKSYETICTHGIFSSELTEFISNYSSVLRVAEESRVGTSTPELLSTNFYPALERWMVIKCLAYPLPLKRLWRPLPPVGVGPCVVVVVTPPPPVVVAVPGTLHTVVKPST
jgi:hypothetical protein